MKREGKSVAEQWCIQRVHALFSAQKIFDVGESRNHHVAKLRGADPRRNDDANLDSYLSIAREAIPWSTGSTLLICHCLLDTTFLILRYRKVLSSLFPFTPHPYSQLQADIGSRAASPKLDGFNFWRNP